MLTPRFFGSQQHRKNLKSEIESRRPAVRMLVKSAMVSWQLWGNAFKTRQSLGMIVESDCVVFAAQPIDDVRPLPIIPQVPSPGSSSKKIQPVR